MDSFHLLFWPWLPKSELRRVPEALTQGLALGTLGVEAMPGPDVAEGGKTA